MTVVINYARVESQLRFLLSYLLDEPVSCSIGSLTVTVIRRIRKLQRKFMHLQPLYTQVLVIIYTPVYDEILPVSCLFLL